MPIDNHTPNLATNINLQQDTSAALNKSNPFLLEVLTSHQLKLKYSIKLNNTADHKLNPKKLKEIKEQAKKKKNFIETSIDHFLNKVAPECADDHVSYFNNYV